MPAKIQCFGDEACTREIALNDLGNYIYRLGSETCVNGDTGDYWYSTIYLKNTGTRAALHTEIVTEEDSQGFLNIEPMELGDLMELQVVPVDIKVTVPRWTGAQNYPITVRIQYYTLPDIDETFYNPYQDEREVWTE